MKVTAQVRREVCELRLRSREIGLKVEIFFVIHFQFLFARCVAVLVCL